MALNRSAVVTASNDGLPMKNTENVDRPMSAMLYSPSRHWPFNPADRRRRLQLGDQPSQGVHAGLLSDTSETGQLDQPNGAI